MCNQPAYTRKCQHKRKGRKCKCKMEFVGVSTVISDTIMFEDWYCRKCNITHRMFVFVVPCNGGVQ